MAITNNEVISTLNGLIETCKDSQEGFKLAAEGVTVNVIKDLCDQCSEQRTQFAGELQHVVRRLGGDPAQSGSVGGSLPGSGTAC